MSTTYVMEKPNYENYFLLEGHFLGLQFDEGWVFFRITSRERTGIKPYNLGSCSAQSPQTDWNDILDSKGDEMLDPENQKYLLHLFTGSKPSEARIYVNFPSGETRMSLRGARTIPSAEAGLAEEFVGYFDGEDSPFDQPSVFTEIITVHQLYPQYKAYNPTNVAMAEVILNVPIMRYTYKLIEDREKIRQFLEGDRRCRLYTIGGITPYAIPEWLEKLQPSGLLEYTKSLTKVG